MAEVWVRPVSGNDGNDGLTYATAKLTLTAGTTLLNTKAAGSYMYIQNEADIAWPTANMDLNAGVGSSFTSFGYAIVGVSDAAKTPATVRIVASGGDAVRRCWRMVAGSGWCIFRNLQFDATAKTGDANVYTAIQWNNADGPIWIDGCSLLVGTTGQTTTTLRALFDISTSSANLDNSRIWYCYFQNCSTIITDAGGTIAIDIKNCLDYFDAPNTGGTVISRTLVAGTGDTFGFTNNTIYRSLGNNASSTPLAISAGGTNLGTFNCHSNLIFIESTAPGAGSPNVEFLFDITAGSVPWSGTIGYNGLFGGPSVDIADLNASGWYSGTFTTGRNPKATDVVAYSVAEATLFRAPASTYAWDQLSNGATVTVLKDLRPILYLTSSFSGSVLGALPAATTDVSVSLVTSRTSPVIDEVFTLTLSVTNTGTSVDSLIVTELLPATLTIDTQTPSQGSYDAITGQWSIGTLASGGTVTLTITCHPNSTASGLSILVTASRTSMSLSDSNAGNDSSSVTLTVPDADDPGGGGDGANPYLDVLPIFADYLTLDTSCRFSTSINRILGTYVRYDKKRSRFREFSHRRIIIAPSTTLTINMGGVQRGKYLMIESDNLIRVSLSTSGDKYLPTATVVFVAMSDFEILKVQNQSSTTAATVQIGVVD